MNVNEATVAVQTEMFRGMSAHPPMHSPHEGYAVLLEEVTELQTEVFTNPTRGCLTPADQRDARMAHVERMRGEAIQVAAMALRFVVELT